MKITKLKRGDCLTVEAREWVDKINGNSYFAGDIYINNERVLEIPFQYGYGSQYEYEAFTLMEKAGIIPKQPTNTVPWQYYRGKNIKTLFHKQTNCLKRDL